MKNKRNILRKTIIIFLATLLIASPCEYASADSYALYVNGRFGYSVKYPKFFKRSGRQSYNGDGVRMKGKGAKLLIWGAYNVIYDDGKGYQKFLRECKEKMSAVKVSKKSLYYEKRSKKNMTFSYAYFVRGGHVVMQLTCKKSKKNYFGKIVNKMKKSMMCEYKNDK